MVRCWRPIPASEAEARGSISCDCHFASRARPAGRGGRRWVVGQTILVVDDDPQLRMILTVFLEDAGYTVRIAPDGQAALDAIAADPPDLVLSDVRMPRLD